MGIIELSELTVRRGRNVVLDKWSISVDSGEVVVLKGDNGCGKSTVIEAAAGLIPLENGQSIISDQLIRDSQGRRGRTNFGLCLQDDCIMGDELVGERLLDAAGHQFDVEKLLEKWSLDHRAHDRVAMLSGGQRRRVAVLAGILPALISEKPVGILLDEPDSGLDDKSVTMLATTLRNLAAGGHAVIVATHNDEIVSSADRVIQFPFEEVESEPVSGKFEKIDVSKSRNPLIGHRMNLRTMAGLANNSIAGLLTLGALLALIEPSELTDRNLVAFSLAPVLAAGLCGNPVHNLTIENRAFAWWNTKSGIPPNAFMHSIIIYALLTTLACTASSDIDVQLILAGALLGIFTEGVVGLLSNATLRLSRPNAVMIRLLTPILILPWAIIVDMLSS